MQTLRRRVLNMSHVEVETSAVEEKSPVSRRFLVVPVMQIDRASIRLSEEIIFDFRRPQLRIDVRFVFTQKTAVFGLDSNDPVHRSELTHRITIWLSEKSRSPHLPPTLRYGATGNPLPKPGTGESQRPRMRIDPPMREAHVGVSQMRSRAEGAAYSTAAWGSAGRGEFHFQLIGSGD